MKRNERQHLKENELAHSLGAAREFVGPRKRLITGLTLVLLLVIVSVVGFMVIRQRMGSRGDELLAQAMVALNARVVPAATPAAGGELPAAAQFNATGTFATEEAKLNAALPKLRAAAEAYPNSDAGIIARYHLAGALATLGRNNEAITAFDEVARFAGTDHLYGRMARLGKTDVQARAGQLDAAIATWKEMAAQQDPGVPVDAVLIGLGRAYVEKGNTAEARKTLTQLVEQHPDSPYVADARTVLEGLKG